MAKYSTRQAAKKLGIGMTTLTRHIETGKIPAPEATVIGRYELRAWSEEDIERVRALLPKIANGMKFHEVIGKTIDQVEVDPDGLAIVVIFQDETALSFDLDPRLSLFPEMSQHRRGEWRSLKRWEPVHTKSSIHKWL